MNPASSMALISNLGCRTARLRSSTSSRDLHLKLSLLAVQRRRVSTLQEDVSSQLREVMRNVPQPVAIAVTRVLQARDPNSALDQRSSTDGTPSSSETSVQDSVMNGTQTTTTPTTSSTSSGSVYQSSNSSPASISHTTPNPSQSPPTTSTSTSRYHGVTLTSFTSLALHPQPLVAFSIRLPSRMAEYLRGGMATLPSEAVMGGVASLTTSSGLGEWAADATATSRSRPGLGEEYPSSGPGSTSLGSLSPPSNTTRSPATTAATPLSRPTATSATTQTPAYPSVPVDSSASASASKSASKSASSSTSNPESASASSHSTSRPYASDPPRGTPHSSPPPPGPSPRNPQSPFSSFPPFSQIPLPASINSLNNLIRPHLTRTNLLAMASSIPVSKLPLPIPGPLRIPVQMALSAGVTSLASYLSSPTAPTPAAAPAQNSDTAPDSGTTPSSGSGHPNPNPFAAASSRSTQSPDFSNPQQSQAGPGPQGTSRPISAGSHPHPVDIASSASANPVPVPVPVHVPAHVTISLLSPSNQPIAESLSRAQTDQSPIFAQEAIWDGGDPPGLLGSVGRLKCQVVGSIPLRDVGLSPIDILGLGSGPGRGQKSASASGAASASDTLQVDPPSIDPASHPGSELFICRVLTVENGPGTGGLDENEVEAEGQQALLHHRRGYIGV